MVAIAPVSSSPQPSPSGAGATSPISVDGELDLGEWTGHPFGGDPRVRCDHIGISRGQVTVGWNVIDAVRSSVETNYGEMTHRLVLVAADTTLELTRSSVRSRQQRENQQAFDALVDAVARFVPDHRLGRGASNRP